MIVKSNEIFFWDCLKILEQTCSWYPSRYSKGAQNYLKQRSIDDKLSIEDCSFVYCDKGHPIIAFLGVIEKRGYKQHVGFHDGPSILLIDNSKITKKISKSFVTEINNILMNVNGVFWLRDFLPNGQLSFLSGFLLSKGASSNNVYSQVIDLKVSKELLWANLRRRYKSLINSGEKLLKPKVFNKDNLTWEMMLNFRKLHITVAKRETRSEDTWKKQYEMVQNNEAFVVLGFIENRLVSAGFFSYSLYHCYYGSSASDRNLFDRPIFHSLMWKAIIYAKSIGCHWFEVGETLFRMDLVKEKGISDFKSGFGGATSLSLDLKINRGSDD